MARTAVKFIRRRITLAHAREVVKEVDRTFNDSVSPHYLSEFKKRIAGWKHRVQFFSKKINTINSLGRFVHAGGKNANYWFWTSLGTKRHPIAAVRAPRLAFRLGYSAKTLPVDMYGVGTGKATGEWRTPIAVDHPGTKARKFEEGINRKQRPWFRKEIRSAIKRGVRKMQK